MKLRLNRLELIERLKANREKVKEEDKKDAERRLKKKIADTKAAIRQYQKWLRNPTRDEWRSNTRSFDAAIKLLELAKDDEVEISRGPYSRLDIESLL